MAIMLAWVIPSVNAAKKPLEKAFPSSEKCKRCHLRVFEEWEGLGSVPVNRDGAVSYHAGAVFGES